MRNLHSLLTAGALAILAATAVLATAEVASRPARGETAAPALPSATMEIRAKH